MINDATAQPRVSLFRRVVRTPLGQLLRGRIGSGTTVEDVVAALPGAAAAVVRHTVRRTRLWRSEKFAVAQELTAHFVDGLEAGVNVDNLVRDFGDPRTAAKLIRRAKIRNRPVIWHISRWTLRGIAAIVLLYVGLGLYYLLGEPRPTVDYLAKLNAPIEATPPEDRAWPLYRQAMIGLGARPDGKYDPPLSFGLSKELRPGHAEWPAVVASLQEHQAELAIVREAAARPHLGFILRTEVDEADRILWPDADAGSRRIGDGALVNTLLPHLSALRGLSNVVLLDFRRATAAGDADAAVADVEAALGLAAHVRASEHPMLISELWKLAMLDDMLAEIRWVMAHQPALFSDAQLAHLAHRLAAIESMLHVSFDGERMIFRDIVQRTYTPGDDGHLTYSGWKTLVDMTGNKPGPRPELLDAAYPGAAAVMLNRAEMVAEYDRLMDGGVAQAAQPMWQWTEWSSDNEVEALANLNYHGLQRVPIAMLTPSVQRAALIAEWGRAEHDATLVAIALELHRRRNGEYPQSLEQLVPGVLPAVPPDRFTGEPLKYRLIGGQPLVYSVGVDRNDDGGTPAKEHDGWPAKEWQPPRAPPSSQAERLVSRMRPGAGQPADGDWILYDPAGVSRAQLNDQSGLIGAPGHVSGGDETEASP